MLDDLRVILEAEAEAHGQFEVARQQAAAIVRQAEAEAQQQVRAAHDAHASDAAAVEARLVAAAQDQANRILATAQATADAMQAQAAARLDKAVEAVVQAVLAPPTQAAQGADNGG